MCGWDLDFGCLTDLTFIARFDVPPNIISKWGPSKAIKERTKHRIETLIFQLIMCIVGYWVMLKSPHDNELVMALRNGWQHLIKDLLTFPGPCLSWKGQLSWVKVLRCVEVHTGWYELRHYQRETTAACYHGVLTPWVHSVLSQPYHSLFHIFFESLLIFGWSTSSIPLVLFASLSLFHLLCLGLGRGHLLLQKGLPKSPRQRVNKGSYVKGHPLLSLM